MDMLFKILLMIVGSVPAIYFVYLLGMMIIDRIKHEDYKTLLGFVLFIGFGLIVAN